MAAKKFCVAILLVSIFALEVQSWNTCAQTPYCSRIRSTTPGNPQFSLDLTSLLVLPNSIEANLLNTAGTAQLKLIITALVDNSYRLTIDEINPSKPRHRVTAALNGDPQQVALLVTDSTADLVTFTAGNILVTLYRSPFKIETYRDGVLINVINSKGLLAFTTGTPDIAIALDINFPGAARAFGIPEHAEHLTLRTTAPGGLDPYRLFNVDYANYNVISTESLYGSIPVLYAHAVARTSGVFWQNSAETWVEITNGASSVDALFMSETGIVDLFVLTGPTLQQATIQYARLTGTAPLPQYFAIAYHQSRYSYMTSDEVLAVINGFDGASFPLDVVWLDIDYTDGKKYFTWHPTNFADPIGMQNYAFSTGRKIVAIIDPHIKREAGYFVNDVAEANGYFVKNPNGTTFEGICWPGLSSYIDFLNPAALDYYAGLFSLQNFQGSTSNLYIWNDMNEPSVFQSLENTMPRDVVHFGGWEHRDVHNLFGFYQTIGTYKGLLARSNNQTRPFILTRAHYAGSQRYTAHWTGDNGASWEYLSISIPMCLTEALAGISFCGADVGGFMGYPDDELFQRWYQAGAWLPFYRAHSVIDSPRREPYLYPADIQVRFRTAMNQRYFHLPLWYTLWWEHTRFAEPVIRPLTYQYYWDINVIDIDSQFLVGSNILVSPVLQPGITSMSIYIPGGFSEIWYDLESGLMHRGQGLFTIPLTLDTIPVFYRGGSIIPRKNTVRSASVYTHDDPIQVYAFLSDAGTATGTLYVDDYETFNYQNKQYLYIGLDYANNVFSTSKIDTDADYAPSPVINTVIVVPVPANVKNATLSSKSITNLPLKITYENNGFMMKISNFNAKLNEPFKIQLF